MKAVSKEVGGTLSDKETPVRRNKSFTDALVTQPLDGVETVTDVLRYASRQWGTKDALGTRPVVRIVEEEKEMKKRVDGKEVTEMKKWKYLELGQYQYLNFKQVEEKVEVLSKAFLSFGMKKGEVFNIYAQTSANWQLVQHSLLAISLIIATAYDTLGESGLTHALNEPECVGVFTNADLLPTLTNVLGNCSTIKYIIYDGDASDPALSKLKAVRGDAVQILHLDELYKIGEQQSTSAEDLKALLPTKDSTACIMYTSGSTGSPKGVVLAHSNLIASVGAVFNHAIGQDISEKDSFLAFLPLSHILAYIVELTLYFMGVTIGYGRVRTLSESGVRNCKGDLKEFRPTLLIGVPAVWETIRKGITQKVNSSGALRKAIFNYAVWLKKLSLPFISSFVGSAVLGVVKQQTGGRLRLALSGGAALSVDTQEFLTATIVQLLQGYGLTESCGMCAILSPVSFASNPSVCYGVSGGTPVPSIEIKLVSVPDAGYLSTNNPPQGEIWIRGPSVTKGYYKRDDLNSDPEIFAEGGWFRTGDVGQWNDKSVTDGGDKGGALTVIDRIKNLIKLSGGEYIALERLESVYKSCHLVANICVHGDSNAKQPIALIVPHEGNLRHALSSNSGTSLSDICASEEAQSLILKECNATGKKAGFKGIEILQAVVLTSEEWTPENGMMTAAQKIQRKKLSDAFSKEIKEAYKNSQGSD